MTTIDPSPILAFILADPASIIASIAANRSFVRLSTHMRDGVSSQNPVTSASGVRGATLPIAKRTNAGATRGQDSGVRVQMETFTSVVYPGETIIENNGYKNDDYGSESKDDLDLEGQSVKHARR